jgi:hypothetical protein
MVSHNELLKHSNANNYRVGGTRQVPLHQSIPKVKVLSSVNRSVCEVDRSLNQDK